MDGAVYYSEVMNTCYEICILHGALMQACKIFNDGNADSHNLFLVLVRST